ncbi:hypothetical protein J5A66_08410 [Prevotella sp. oral taxon 475]|uniref:hypothetical protein n=1 Tax=Prevotella sp. oral taxon 475 TaxID=712471 RepID=UPI001BA48B6D|nr:hypothetical protein [Prevotella sp. oral taxon 475]QUB46970.1 hypothetical protein J5A66_08410 [Prevotella sp. oral taxon 475]
MLTDIVVGTRADGQTGDAGQHGGKASMKNGIGMFHCYYSLLGVARFALPHLTAMRL